MCFKKKTIPKFRSCYLSLKKLSLLKKVSVYRNKSLSFIIHRFRRERPSFCLSRSKNVSSLDFSMTLLALNIYGVLFVMIVTLVGVPFLVVVTARAFPFQQNSVIVLSDSAPSPFFLAPSKRNRERKRRKKINELATEKTRCDATRLPREIGRLPFVGKKLMRGYARLDSDRPFIRRQSILVLSAVDSMLSESSVSKPPPTTNGHCCRATRIPVGRSGTARYNTHVPGEREYTPASSHHMCITSLYIYAFLYIYIYFYVRRMMQCTVVELLLEVIIFCPVATVTPRHAGSATCLLDEAICCFRVGRLLFRTKWTRRFSPVSR